MSVFALPGENRTNEIWVELNGNTSKSFLDIIVCDLKKDWQILIIFDANIFDTPGIQWKWPGSQDCNPYSLLYWFLFSVGCR